MPLRNDPLRLLALALLATVPGCSPPHEEAPGEETAQVLPDPTGRTTPAPPSDTLTDSIPGLVESHPWTVDEVGESPPEGPGVVTVRSLETEAHVAFDRIVVTLGGDRLAGYHVEYVDRPLHECGSGRQIHPPGEGWLRLRLTRARGHTEAGEATLQRRLETPHLSGVRRIDRTCDFEGNVELVLSVSSPGPYRLSVAEDPTRLVLDVRGEGTGAGP